MTDTELKLYHDALLVAMRAIMDNEKDFNVAEMSRSVPGGDIYNVTAAMASGYAMAIVETSQNTQKSFAKNGG